MADFEKLGVFYLGRVYDLEARRRTDRLLLYDSQDLVTHAVCIGMTGSGKTGLCLSLIEEALLDGIPALLIDPKGDLANLLLTFPDLRAEDFAPWVDAEAARRQNLSVDEYAARQAALWSKGLAEWGQDGERIRRLRAAVDLAVYTPGSTAGQPVSIARSFAAPPPALIADADLLRDRLTTAATGLLALLGIEGDPLRSREHILVSRILEAAWREGRSLDLAALIAAVQSPPVARVGALDLESFYPARERFALVAALNNLLASPGFDTWLSGAPLDIDQMLHGPDGKPRASIFSIAHLGDPERMFFVSLLLNEILGWVRSQSGTPSLRALVYMDEVFGYFPPVADPPSKLPLLTLLKQARAFGVGVVLATQNPVDLDYKGLANTGTWFIGRLQTERDKARVLEGLEGAAAGAAGRFDRGRMEAVLAGLGSRVFLLNNVHEDAPAVFETRWAMSYLRGPLTRDQLRRLAAPGAAGAAPVAPAPPPAPAALPRAAAAAAVPAPAAPGTAARPVLPPEIPQHFLPIRGEAPPGAAIHYQPMLLGAARVRLADARAGVEATEDAVVLAHLGSDLVPVSWDDARATTVAIEDLDPEPAPGATFGPLPAAAARPKSYQGWTRDLAGWLYRGRKLELFRLPGSRQLSRPGESERDFRIRLGESGREQRDHLKAELRRRYVARIAALEERERRAGQAVSREQEQVSQAGLQAGISLVATVLGAVLGRKAVSAGSVGRATTAARSAGRVLKERQDVGRAQETLDAVARQRADLEAALAGEVAKLEASGDPLTAPLELVAIRPKKSDVAVRLVALAWAPFATTSGGAATPLWE
jgi:hypothetical protein